MLVLACDELLKKEPPREPPAESSSADPRANLPEANPAESASPWPEDVVSLRQSLEAFDTVEGCREALRRRVPSELAEILADLSYDDALGEACRAIDAVKRNDPAACDTLVGGAVGRACRIRLATFHEVPEACPDAVGAAGRDAMCLAWATRDAALCDGAPRHLRARCVAVATDDERLCRSSAERAPVACAALVSRLGDLVDVQGPPRRDPRSLRAAGEAPEAVAVNADDAVERGVFLQAVEGRCAYRWHVAPEPSSWIGPSRGSDTETATLTFAATIDAEGHLELTSESELNLGVVGTPYPLEGSATLEKFSLERGGALEGTVAATFHRDGRPRTVQITFASFVRDMQPLPERCSEE